jgi:hypothetical protein
MGQDAKLEHRLAATMDVVGYSQSMQSDEAGTFAALGAIREATQNQISHHRGRIAYTAGDRCYWSSRASSKQWVILTMAQPSQIFLWCSTPEFDGMASPRLGEGLFGEPEVAIDCALCV